jgi:hypothetical protein
VLDPHFVYLAAAVASIGVVLYGIEMFRGEAHPNRVSWLLWGLLPVSTWLASISEGAGPSAFFALATGLGALVIFGLSFFVRQAYWKTTRLDYVCGACSVLAIALWAATRNGNLAIVLLLLADGLAATPTIRKAYRSPESEYALTYVLSGMSAVITLLTIDDWTVANAAFPGYILLANAVIVVPQTLARRPSEVVVAESEE